MHQKLLKHIIVEEIKRQNRRDDYKSFVLYLDNYYVGGKFIMNESVLKEFSGIADKISFIKQLASKVHTKMDDLVELMKNSKVYEIFSKLKWSMKNLWSMVTKGYDMYKLLYDKIAEYAAKNKIVKWTSKHLHELDKWLESHPTIKKIGGVAVGALLIFLWTRMGSSGHIDIDFNVDTILDAVTGNFSLHALFGGENGMKILLLLATGALGLSFPWPGAQSTQFIGAVIVSLGKLIKKKIRI